MKFHEFRFFVYCVQRLTNNKKMSVNIEINAKQLSDKEPLQVHYLPVKINGDGEANVDKYFNNYTLSEQGFLSNAFRGFPLHGEELQVPQGYKAVVLQETRKPLDEDADRTLRVAGSFNKFTYWNYDKMPTKADAYKQALEVLEVSNELAKPITEVEVLAEMELQKPKTKSKENN